MMRTSKDIEKIKRILKDFRLFAKNFLYIQTVEGDKVPFTLNPIQILLEKIILDIKSKGRPVRLVILKARREGVSTWTAGRFYWQVATHKNRYSYIITHEPEASTFLHEMTRRFQNYIPDSIKLSKKDTEVALKPKIKYSNRKELTFSDLDSAITVATAGKDDIGSGQTIHYLHMSEVTKWPPSRQRDILISVLQCVPDTIDTEVIFESTAKGIGGEFYHRFWNCRYRYEFYVKNQDGRPPEVSFRQTINEDTAADNIYTSVFIPWFAFDKYRIDTPILTEKDSTERELVSLCNLDDKQVAWRRWAIANKCSGDLSIFKQEYPSNANEAFISSGRPVFDIDKLLVMREKAKKPIARYDIRSSIEKHNKGLLRVWKEPDPKLKYVIGADVAEGLEHGDFSSADVLEVVTGRQVAQWHGHVNPYKFGDMLVLLAKKYNNAWIVPERNNHGLSTVYAIENTDYSNLYVEMVEEPPAKSRKRYGWLTNTNTKYLIIDRLALDLFEESLSAINCVETINEMLTYKVDEEGGYNAQEGAFDDRVMSFAIAYFVRNKPIIKNDSYYKDTIKDRAHDLDYNSTIEVIL